MSYFTKITLSILILFSVNIIATQASSFPQNDKKGPNSIKISQKQTRAQKRTSKFLNSKFGQWLLKKAIRKVKKKQERFEKRITRKKAKKGENWEPKKTKSDVGVVLALLFIGVGLLIGLIGLLTLPTNPILAEQIFYVSGGILCAGLGIMAY